MLWSLIYGLGDLFSPFKAATEYSGLYIYTLLFVVCFDCLLGLRLFFGFFFIFFFLCRKLLVVWGSYDFTKKYFWGVEETWAHLCSSWCLVLLACLSFNFCSNSCSQLPPCPSLWTRSCRTMPGERHSMCDSTQGWRLLGIPRTSSPAWSCGENLCRSYKYSTLVVFPDRNTKSFQGRNI